MNTIIMVITIAIYLIFMVVVGYWFSKKNANSGDYYLGGRKLGPFVTAMSAEASDMSSYLLMGIPGLALFSGVAEAGWTCIGLAVGTYLNWLIVSKRIRNYSQKIGAITVPQYMSKRFGDKKNILSFIAAIVILIFFIPYTASGFSACGKLFKLIFNVEYVPAMVISALVIIVYTTLGGFLAASTTDLIQSIIMTIALFIIVFFGIGYAGGIENVIENAKALPGYLSLKSIFAASSGEAKDFSFLQIISTLAWGFGYFGMPHILLRFMAIEKPSELKLSRRIASVWVVISMSVAIFIGIIGNAVVKAGFTSVDAMNNTSSESIMIELSKLISENGFFFAIIAGLVLSGILAATMSTADSQLLAASSSVTEDIITDFFKVKLSEKKLMLLARITTLLIAVVGIVIALNENSTVFGIVSFAWAGFGAAFGPVILFSLFWKRTNFAGALAGMVSGGAMVFIWKYVIAKLGGVFAIYELLPAFVISCIFIVLFSLLTKKPEKEIIDTFEEIKAEK